MRRSVRIFVELVVALVGLMLLGCALLIWRLSSSPINSTFLTPYIESGIERYIPGTHAQIKHTLMTWDNADHSVSLHADGMVIKNTTDKVIAEVPNLDIRLSVLGLIVGQFWPIELTIDHPQFKLNRHQDGKLYFAALTTSGSDSETESNSREVLKNTLHNLTHAYAMRHLTVFRAAVGVHDEATGRDWAVSVPEITLMRTFTQLVGSAKIDLAQKSGPASLELRYAYDHMQSLHRVSTRFQQITPAQLAGGHPEALGLGAALIFDLPLSGEMEVAFDPDLNVAAAAATLHGDEGKLNIPALWDKPRAVKNFDVEGAFDSKAHKLDVQTALFDFGGPKLKLVATGHEPADAEKYDLDFTLNAQIENWPMDGFADLWPKPIIPNAREWMEQNLSKGMYEKGEGVFSGSLAWNDLANLNVSEGHGKVSAAHGTVSYIDGMPPVQNVHAVADFDLNQMSILLSDGNLGDLRIQPFTATISGLSADEQFIDLPLKVAGPIPDVIKLIDYPPLHYASKIGLPHDALSGTVEGTVNLRLPLLKDLATKDIDVTATANLSNVASSSFVKGLDLTQGDLALALAKDNFTVKGPLNVNKIPVQLAMQEYFEERAGRPLRQVDVSGTIGNEQWKELGSSFAGTAGSAAVKLQIVEPDKKRMRLSGSADLTDADLRFNPLGWRKTAHAAALLKFEGEQMVGKDMLIKSLSLTGPQAYVQGKATIGKDGSVKSANFMPLRIGRTSANVSFSQSAEKDGALRFEVEGKSLDVSGMQGGKEPARADPRPKEYRLNVEKLYTSDTGVITNAEGYAIRDSEGWSEISMHGLADSDHQFTMELTPQSDGTRVFNVTCDDFGKMLKGFGVTDTVKDGDVKIEGHSTLEQPRVIQGTIKVESFNVGNLPVLVTLLNATSPLGFVGLMTNSMSFNHIKGVFLWSGDTIEFKHVNIPGSSVGMTVDGKVDMNSSNANLRGAIVPFSIVNEVLGSIPLLGDLLTGGNGGGVLAVAYTIKGPLSGPRVEVNPVSLLTPGFLRNLFFGGDDDDDVSDDIVPETP